jgi:thiamine-monophosphate kinase
MGLPKNISLKKTEKIFAGANDIAQEFGVNLVGGDLSASPGITIDVSMLGIVEKKNLVLRKGAKAGDIIFVTGPLGGSIRGKHLKFIPRVKEARFLAKNFHLTSMIDISDGLVQDLGHILKVNNAGAALYSWLIPKSLKARSLDEALYMGEDFELLFTVSRPDARKIVIKHPEFRAIGEVLGRGYGLKLVDERGKESKLAEKGYRHF